LWNDSVENWIFVMKFFRECWFFTCSCPTKQNKTIIKITWILIIFSIQYWIFISSYQYRVLWNSLQFWGPDLCTTGMKIVQRIYSIIFWWRNFLYSYFLRIFWNNFITSDLPPSQCVLHDVFQWEYQKIQVGSWYSFLIMLLMKSPMSQWILLEVNAINDCGIEKKIYLRK
jgi:hypothetical protein